MSRIDLDEFGLSYSRFVRDTPVYSLILRSGLIARDEITVRVFFLLVWQLNVLATGVQS